MEPITLQQIKEEVIRLGTEKPDFVYNDSEDITAQCSYTTDIEGGTENDGCIFGQALQNLGIDKKVLEGEIGEIGGVVAKLGFDGLLEYDKTHDETKKLLPTFGTVQSNQDMGCSWGHSIEPLK